MNIIGVVLVGLDTTHKDCHFNQCVIECGVFLDVLTISADVCVHTFGRGCTSLSALGLVAILSAELGIAFLMGDGLQCHQPEVDELELGCQLSTDSFAEVKSGIVGTDVADIVETQKISHDVQCFGFGGNCGDFTPCQPLGIDLKILLCVIIVLDFFVELHHQ